MDKTMAVEFKSCSSFRVFIGGFKFLDIREVSPNECYNYSIHLDLKWNKKMIESV